MAPSALASVIQIERPAPPSIVQELAPLVAEAKAFEVPDVHSHALALERIKVLRSGERKILEYWEPSRKAADAAKREILAARDGLIGPLAEARVIYDRKAAEYEAAERRKAEEEQRRLQEQARKEEEERQLADAQAAQDAGDAVLAEAIIQEPVSVPAVRVAPAIAQVAGVSTRTLWSAEVTDLLALVKYVAQHPEWVSLLEPAMPNLNRLAVAQRDALKIPGVRAVATTSRSTR
jgi:hypothetical protein